MRHLRLEVAIACEPGDAEAFSNAVSALAQNIYNTFPPVVCSCHGIACDKPPRQPTVFMAIWEEDGDQVTAWVNDRVGTSGTVAKLNETVVQVDNDEIVILGR